MDRVWRVFGPHPAVVDLTLTVADGEFLVLLGPSGCGKTTSLRMLAGLERPSAGEIRIDGAVVNHVPPGQRDIALVFQSYALYPHMTVYRNLAFGPRVRGENRARTRQAIAEVATTLRLDKLLDRRPSELSGGQRQRVALGRALLRRPKLFLMDEPLSNLDAALRGEVRAELVRLHRQFGITTVYVTHDQVEAMTMADRIAIMFEGRLHQAGGTQEIYDDPVDRLVAGFIGSPHMNFVDGTLLADNGDLAVDCCSTRLSLPRAIGLRAETSPPLPVVIGVRPHDLEPRGPDEPCEGALPGVVEFVEPMGAENFLTVRCGDARLVSRAAGRARHVVGESVKLRVDTRFVYAFDKQTGISLLDRGALGPAQSGRIGTAITQNHMQTPEMAVVGGI